MTRRRQLYLERQAELATESVLVQRQERDRRGLGAQEDP
jgi:hypothetical protein